MYCKRNLNVILNLILILALLFFSSCGKRKTEQNTTVSSSEAPSPAVKITATFYPLYVICLNLTQNVPEAQVTMLNSSSAGCLHDYQFSTRDMKIVSKCDILVANGAGMENFMDRLLEQKKDHLIVACDGYELMDENPHIWVSTKGAKFMVNRIASGLMRLDPRNSSLYEENCRAYERKLQDLEDEMHRSLDRYAGKKIITFHEAFPYFAREFNLEIQSVIEREPGTSPSPRELENQIAQIRQEIADGTKPALFAEPQYPASSAEIVAKETGLRIYILDPCVSGTAEPSEKTKNSYVDTMKKNLTVLEEALEG